MTRYQMSDGSIVDLKNASGSWDEDTQFDGNNHISMATGNQWEHETLYRSRRGRFYIETTSQWQGSTPRAEWVSNEKATRWLMVNGHDTTDDDWPAELTEYVEEVME